MKKSWKQMKLESLDLLYGTTYNDYSQAIADTGCDDDRRVFMNTYNAIIKAVKSLPDEPDSYIKVAMWRQINRDKETLNNIMARFCD